jgi:hypothetical protein
MARTKPLSELSPAYRRRIERGLASGKTRQQARGHGTSGPGTTEYQKRMWRQAENLLTKARRESGSGQAVDDNETIAELVLELGYARTIRFLKAKAEATRRYAEYEDYDEPVAVMHHEADDYDINVSWYWYH